MRPVASKGVSSDFRFAAAPFKVREVHRNAVNLESSSGDRVSLVLTPSLMGPRTALVEDIVGLVDGQEVEVLSAPVIYHPSVLGLGPDSSMRPLWLEWLEILEDPEMWFLREPVEARDPMMLVGLGPGHTPAGDDVLTGWLLARWALEDAGAAERFLRDFCPARTSWFSSDQLLCAARGLAWSVSRSLLEAISLGDGARALDAVGQAMAVGHTSGRCCLLGMALGMEGLWIS